MAFCGKCGSEIGNDNVFCPKCGALVDQQDTPVPSSTQGSMQQNSYNAVNSQSPQQQSYSSQQYNQQGNTYGNNSRPQYPSQQPADTTGILIWSILTALFCCTPLGIAAIVFSTQAKKSASWEEAQSKLKNAKLMCIIGDITGAVILIIALASGMYETLM